MDKQPDDRGTDEHGRDPRRLFTKKQRAEIFDRDGGRCRDCGAKIARGEWQADHIVPWSLGGRTETDNGRVVGVSCGCAVKCNGKDTSGIARAKKLAGETCQGEPKRKLRSRPFQKPPKGYKWRWPKRKLR